MINIKSILRGNMKIIISFFVIFVIGILTISGIIYESISSADESFGDNVKKIYSKILSFPKLVGSYLEIDEFADNLSMNKAYKKGAFVGIAMIKQLY